MMNLLPWKKKKKSVAAAEQGNEIGHVFNRLFDDAFFSPMGMLTEGSRYPRAEISTGKKHVTVRMEIPGIDAGDIDVSLDGRLLTIKGEKRQDKESKEESFHLIERSYGKFQRTMEMPVEVDDSDVSATYKKGVLKVVMKKSRPVDTRTIKVKVG